MANKFNILCETAMASYSTEPQKPVALKPKLDEIQHELQIGGTITDEDIAPFVNDVGQESLRKTAAIFVLPLYFTLLRYKQYDLLRKNINKFISIIASSSEQSRKFAGQIIVDARHDISKGKKSNPIIPKPILDRLFKSPSVFSELVKNQDVLSDDTIAEIKNLMEIRKNMSNTPKDTRESGSEYSDVSKLPSGQKRLSGTEIPKLDMGSKLQKRHTSGSESIPHLSTKFDRFKTNLKNKIKSKFGRK